MQKKLNGPRILARKGVAKKLVIILHGYGADGSNLIGLGEYWSDYLETTAFVAPNAPEICEDFPCGYQWFSMREWFASRDWRLNVINERARLLAPTLKSFIRDEMAFHSIADDKDVVLVGFSQGAMVALYTALYALEGVRGVIAYSGGFIPDHTMKISGAPSVLLYHGEQDFAVPSEASRVAFTELQALDVAVDFNLEKDLGHEISEQGLQKGLAFLRQVFNT